MNGDSYERIKNCAYSELMTFVEKVYSKFLNKVHIVFVFLYDNLMHKRFVFRKKILFLLVVMFVFT